MGSSRVHELLPNLSVSRETLDNLEHYSSLLRRWTQKINLIAPNTVPTLWARHILDSAQLISFIPTTATRIVDLGSGGGLPAIVLSILLKDLNKDAVVIMVESDIRKSTFLQTVIRELDLNASVKTNRISELEPIGSDVVTARALAPLDPLLEMVNLHLGTEGIALLPKGKNFLQEVDVARKNWKMKITEHPSLTNPEARLLEIEDIMRVTS